MRNAGCHVKWHCRSFMSDCAVEQLNMAAHTTGEPFGPAFLVHFNAFFSPLAYMHTLQQSLNCLWFPSILKFGSTFLNLSKTPRYSTLRYVYNKSVEYWYLIMGAITRYDNARYGRNRGDGWGCFSPPPPHTHTHSFLKTLKSYWENVFQSSPTLSH